MFGAGLVAGLLRRVLRDARAGVRGGGGDRRADLRPVVRGGTSRQARARPRGRDGDGRRHPCRAARVEPGHGERHPRRGASHAGDAARRQERWELSTSSRAPSVPGRSGRRCPWCSRAGGCAGADTSMCRRPGAGPSLRVGRAYVLDGDVLRASEVRVRPGPPSTSSAADALSAWRYGPALRARTSRRRRLVLTTARGRRTPSPRRVRALRPEGDVRIEQLTAARQRARARGRPGRRVRDGVGAARGGDAEVHRWERRTPRGGTRRSWEGRAWGAEKGRESYRRRRGLQLEVGVAQGPDSAQDGARGDLAGRRRS